MQSKSLIIGLGTLGFVGIVFFYFFITAIYLDEAGIDLTVPPSSIEYSGKVGVAHTIFINSSDEIQIEGKKISFQDLQEKMQSERYIEQNQAIILRMDENASHGILVDTKDMLDGLGYGARLEIIRSSTDNAK